jgi:hypothetical protein
MSETKAVYSTGPLSAADLAAIRERELAATPGPWEWSGRVNQYDPSPFSIYSRATFAHVFEVSEECQCNVEISDADLAFIVAARTDMPVLLAHIDALEADLADAAPLTKAQFDYIYEHTPDANIAQAERAVALAAVAETGAERAYMMHLHQPNYSDEIPSDFYRLWRDAVTERQVAVAAYLAARGGSDGA